MWGLFLVVIVMESVIGIYWLVVIRVKYFRVAGEFFKLIVLLFRNIGVFIVFL